jgi:Poly-adenylate binding protein, unique domain
MNLLLARQRSHAAAAARGTAAMGDAAAGTAAGPQVDSRSSGISGAAASPLPSIAGGAIVDYRFLEELASADERTRRNLLGEKLYPMVHRLEPQRAGKVTGMFLEMGVSEVLNLLESREALLGKVKEAVRVLQEAESRNSRRGPY